MRKFLRPPNRASASARVMARELGVRMLRRRNSRYRYRPGDVIINWGNPDPMDVPAIVNHPSAVSRAINKRDAWSAFADAGVPTVEWTQCREQAGLWLGEDQRVLARATLRGSQGRGMTVYSREGTDWTEHGATLPEGATYVKVFGRNPRHVTEYRVHICNGKVIDYQQKKRRRNYESRINPYIRGHRFGWIFARSDIPTIPWDVSCAATRATEVLGLTFGAVDIAASRHGGVCVYEINTAPGIEGTTLDAYAGALNSC